MRCACYCETAVKKREVDFQMFFYTIFYTRAQHNPKQKPTAAPSLPLERPPSPALNLAS